MIHIKLKYRYKVFSIICNTLLLHIFKIILYLVFILFLYTLTYLYMLYSRGRQRHKGEPAPDLGDGVQQHRCEQHHGRAHQARGQGSQVWERPRDVRKHCAIDGAANARVHGGPQYAGKGAVQRGAAGGICAVRGGQCRHFWSLRLQWQCRPRQSCVVVEGPECSLQVPGLFPQTSHVFLETCHMLQGCQTG